LRLGSADACAGTGRPALRMSSLGGPSMAGVPHACGSSRSTTSASLIARKCCNHAHAAPSPGRIRDRETAARGKNPATPSRPSEPRSRGARSSPIAKLPAGTCGPCAYIGKSSQPEGDCAPSDESLGSAQLLVWRSWVRDWLLPGTAAGVPRYEVVSRRRSWRWPSTGSALVFAGAEQPRHERAGTVTAMCRLGMRSDNWTDQRAG
jgi:hypothetical protein